MLSTVKSNRRPELSGKVRLHDEVGVNAAYLQEIKEDERQVPTLLAFVTKRLYANQLNTEQSSELRALMRQLHQQVKYRFHLEEALGYMEDVVQVAPRLCRKAESLRSEHQQLLDQLQELVELAHATLLEKPASLKEIIPIRDSFASFHQQFQAHEAGENDLIIDSLYFDIGGGD